MGEFRSLFFVLSAVLLAIAAVLLLTIGLGFSLHLAEGLSPQVLPALGVFCGAWLLLYGFVLRDTNQNAIRVSVMAGTGASLVLLTPLVDALFPGTDAAAVLLVGIIVSIVHPFLTAMVAAGTTGTILAGVLWHFIYCPRALGSRLASSSAMYLHATVLALVSGLAIITFTCTKWGVESFQVFLVPVVGALLLVAGVLGLSQPSEASAGLEAVFYYDHCTALSLDVCLLAVAAWLLATVAGSAGMMKRLRASSSASQGMLAAPFLSKEANDGLMPRPDGMTNMNRHQIICEAIFLPEDADLSHLSEHEKQLVRAVRNDEDERNRLLWGGGLY